MTAITHYSQDDEISFGTKTAPSPVPSSRLAGGESYPSHDGEDSDYKAHGNIRQSPRLRMMDYHTDTILEEESPDREVGYKQQYSAVHHGLQQPQSAIIYSNSNNPSFEFAPSHEFSDQGSSIRPVTSDEDTLADSLAAQSLDEPEPIVQPLKYAHVEHVTEEQLRNTQGSPNSLDSDQRRNRNNLAPHDRAPNRKSTNALNSGVYSFYGEFRGRAGSPGNPTQSTALSDHSRRSSEGEAPGVYTFDNSHLKEAVGKDASLLSHEKTIELYRQNAVKTNDPSIQ